MKATLKRLSTGSAEKDARIKCQQEHIAKLMKKLEKRATCTDKDQALVQDSAPLNHLENANSSTKT